VLWAAEVAVASELLGRANVHGTSLGDPARKTAVENGNLVMSKH
jgi:hypothetical protein